MIKVRLLKMLKEGTLYVLLEVLWQWFGLVAQIILITCVTKAMTGVLAKNISAKGLAIYFVVALCAILARLIFDRLYTGASYRASVDVKAVLRRDIYEKLLRLGSGYKSKVSSAQITQMMGEGVEQLEVYFGKYISQFIYSLLAPITLFIVLYRYNSKAALVLLIAVPLIPMVIMVVMKIARKLLDKYFKIYYSLGDSFLEKLHGLTTLKIYQADEKAAADMDKESENFRVITMKVLSMQLNSTIVMDVVAYAGAAFGIAVSINEFLNGRLDFTGAMMFLLLAAEFFLPMRLLGSYFHIGMNGMKAADKIFEFLDLPETEQGKLEIAEGPYDIVIDAMSYSHGKTSVLKGLNMYIPAGKIVSLVGVSGSGKSTLAGILRHQYHGYTGTITVAGKNLKKINEKSLMSAVTTVSLNSYVFPGTVRDNLLLGNSKANDNKLLNALKVVNLLEELTSMGGLDLMLNEGGSNLSGGQRQRLVLARALLKNSPIYIFDEATSNIDMESEAIIMKVIYKLSKELGKTVLLISHRLANVVASDEIFMLEDGGIVESGSHVKLMQNQGEYAKLYMKQHALETYGGGASHE